MPKLPNAEWAFVEIEKLRDYALNPEHDEGQHKARVFRAALGFTQADAERLREMVLKAALRKSFIRRDNRYRTRLILPETLFHLSNFS